MPLGCFCALWWPQPGHWVCPLSGQVWLHSRLLRKCSTLLSSITKIIHVLLGRKVIFIFLNLQISSMNTLERRGGKWNKNMLNTKCYMCILSPKYYKWVLSSYLSPIFSSLNADLPTQGINIYLLMFHMYSKLVLSQFCLLFLFCILFECLFLSFIQNFTDFLLQLVLIKVGVWAPAYALAVIRKEKLWRVWGRMSL